MVVSSIAHNSVISAEIISTTFPGLTKREYFAAMAMQGMLSNPEINGMAVNFSCEL